MKNTTVVPASEVADEALLGCLNDAFGRHRSLDWFRWKHRSGPWGPSAGWAAVDGDEVAGVRLATPWIVTDPGGVSRLVVRMTDGAVSPRAQRQGIFTRLVIAETDSRRGEGGWACLLSTAVPASRAAYQKLGWSLPPLVRVATTARWRPRPPHVTDAPVTALASAATSSPGLATAWDSASLTWRFDPRSGHDYRAACLTNSNSGTAVVYRTTRSHGISTLVEVLGRGPEGERDLLLAGVARQHGCILTIRYVGPGTDRPHAPRAAWQAGGPALAIWATQQALDATSLDHWCFSAADLEGVI
jgi:GNAT superfamily N-acetyltransferase